MLIQFTLQDLMLFLVCLLGIVAGILLLPILWNIKKAVGILQPLLETNQELIKNTIQTMPKIIGNVGQISSNIKDSTDKLRVTFPLILHEVECVTASAKGSIELAGVALEKMGSGINEAVACNKKEDTGFMAYLHIIEEVVQIIYRTFSSSK